ncbi:hypothetical protein ABEB36_008998 [Hypothenemus hampei]|uniref:Huntingtin n=1 Tax=Hypothenemus hampei TaxID=57062 RepID=A0ABD1ENT3_HYPHA
MATQERLHKSLEILKTLSINQPPDQAKKKEKIHHCYVVAEAFSNPTIKVSSNFTVLLDVAIETFLKLSDDNDSDVRMTSDECLNRIIRAVSDRHLGKVQYELLKEIQKNGSSRSLRAALIRFSQLAHQIKPTKGKAYAANLLPKIVRIAERTEEVIHETLVACLPKILQSLGPFALDNDLKELLKSFLQNINKPSAAIRRTSASCIEIICRYSRRPSIFTSYCVNCLLDLVIPVDVVQDAWFILGVLQCVKLLLTHLNNVSEVEDEQSRVVQKLVQPIATNKLLQIYELCIYYLTNPDHNIVNASLDTLNTLLLNAPNDLKIMLLNPNGIDRSRIHKSLSVNNIRSPSAYFLINS